MSSQWQIIQENLENRLDAGTFKVWIKPLRASMDGSRLVLFVPNQFYANWLKNHIFETLLAAARDVCGTNADISIKISANTNITSSIASAEPPQNVLPLHLPYRKALPKQSWRFNFDDFVVGDSNRMAVAAAKEVCREGGDVQTLFVYANAGMGKTHLSQAIGQDISIAKRRVAYLTAEDFVSRFVSALHRHELEDFKKHLCDLDVLLFEDVHFLQGKPKMQETALGIVKSIQGNGGRVVFTSSFSPKELQKVDSHLVSYFCSGIMEHIDSPDSKMRYDILKKKAYSFGMVLNDDVLSFLSERLDGDIRQLVSCLKNLAFKLKMADGKLTKDIILDVLEQFVDRMCHPTAQNLVHLVCESYGLDEIALCSKSRSHAIVIARNTFYYLARLHTALTLRDIGQILNRRHSTVLQGITTVEREISRGTNLGRQIAHAIALVEKKAGLNRGC